MPDASTWSIDPFEMAAVLLGIAPYLGTVAVILLGFYLIRMVGR